MWVQQQSLMGQAHEEWVDSDSVSTDTSRWSTPSSLHCGSNSSPYSSEDRGEKVHRQKTNYAASDQVQKLPPIKPLQVSNPKNLSANLSCIRELKNQVGDLQQQLTKARTENKLLKRLQHRHMVALQHFQDSEGSLSQIITKHKNEARVLQRMLRETRACRDSLARQLKATENKLLSTKASLQHLHLLSQDQSLLEREELTLRLTKATAELEKKDKRILDLENNIELCQASFNRQLVTEKRKTNEARNLSCHQQELILQLSRDIQDRQRELETHNIYSHRFLKGFSKKDTGEQKSCSEESLQDQTEGDCVEEKESSQAPWVLEEDLETEEHESEVSHISEKSLDTAEPRSQGYRLSKIRRNYTFKQTYENLHNGKPAYSSVDLNPSKSNKNPMRVENLSDGNSELCLPAWKLREARAGSPKCE
ncbi:uncharacterized protein ABDE67_002289 [Symphorus nematophorus]